MNRIKNIKRTASKKESTFVKNFGTLENEKRKSDKEKEIEFHLGYLEISNIINEKIKGKKSDRQDFNKEKEEEIDFLEILVFII